MNPQALNRYSYVYNNPLKCIDPSGHDPGWQAHVEDTKAKIEDDKLQKELYGVANSPIQLDLPAADYSYESGVGSSSSVPETTIRTAQSSTAATVTIRVTVANPVGVTGGLIAADDETYPYAGVVIAGSSGGSLTFSSLNPEPGWHVVPFMVCARHTHQFQSK